MGTGWGGQMVILQVGNFSCCELGFLLVYLGRG